VATLGVTWRY